MIPPNRPNVDRKLTRCNPHVWDWRYVINIFRGGEKKSIKINHKCKGWEHRRLLKASFQAWSTVSQCYFQLTSPRNKSCPFSFWSRRNKCWQGSQPRLDPKCPVPRKDKAHPKIVDKESGGTDRRRRWVGRPIDTKTRYGSTGFHFGLCSVATRTWKMRFKENCHST